MFPSLIIPCYNESEGVDQLHEQLAALCPELEQHGSFEVLLIDDGSSDDTFTRLSSAFAGWDNARIIRHERNRGLGDALRTGFAAAQGEVLITTDSDGTYPFATIPAMLDLLRPGVHVVTASPYHPQGGVDGVPAYRLLFSRGASTIYRLLLDPRIHTYTAMYRAYRREVIERVPTRAPGFLMVTELLVGALLAGYKVAELPAILRVRRYGQSKAKVWGITRSHLRFQAGVLRRRASMLIGVRPQPRGTA